MTKPTRKAKEKVDELKGFYSHLFAYILFNALFAIINHLTSPGIYWFWWISLFWGIGLLMHAWHVFGHSRIFGEDWEDRKIQEYMENKRKPSIPTVTQSPSGRGLKGGKNPSTF